MKNFWFWDGLLEPRPGADLTNCLEEAKNMIGRGQIWFTFNGFPIIIKRDSDLDDIIKKYHKHRG